MGLPWWAWILGIVVIGLVVFVGSWRHYRTNIRNKFLAYLAAQHPELEIGEVTSESVVVTTAEGGEGTLFLDRLYREAPPIELEDEEGYRELFARFVGTILEGQEALTVDAERDRDRVYPRIVEATGPGRRPSRSAATRSRRFPWVRQAWPSSLYSTMKTAWPIFKASNWRTWGSHRPRRWIWP